MLLIFLLLLKSNTIVSDPENTVRKVKKYLELIKTKRIVAFKEANNCEVCYNATASHNLPSSENYTWSSFNSTTPFEFGILKYHWLAFRAKLEVSEDYDPSVHSIYMRFNLNRNFLVRPWDDDTPAGPEGRVWVNKKAFTAIDEFHNGATIPHSIIDENNGKMDFEARIFSSRCKSNIVLNKFGLEIIHKKTDALYQRIRFLSSVIKELPEESRERYQLIKILDSTVRLIDIRDLNYPIELADIRQHDLNATAFYQSVDAAYENLIKKLNDLPKPTENDPAISLIGYSHIDTCWLWPYNITRFKIANTATTMLRLIDFPPEEFSGHEAQYKFLGTSAQHYQWLKEDSPEIYERIKEAFKNKRWNIDGVSWIEPDTNLPSGESLVRQIIMGMRFFEKEFGAKQTVMFLPDCFGFSANLPQILRHAGIDSFVTSKISWSEYTKFPYSTFIWRGIDGSDILSHFITTPSQWSYQTATYTGVSTAYEMIGTLKEYKQRDILPTSALHTSGNGDGGGGITEEMIWNINIMKELPHVPNVPRLIFPTLEELFIPIRNKTDELPIWDDELYLEYHRGTLTTQEEIKRQNRQLEAQLHNCEWLCTVIRALFKMDIQKYLNQLEKIWEETLIFHFHDAIPGSSVNEANYDIVNRGRPLLKQLKEIQKELSSIITRHIRTPTEENAQIIFNTLSHTRLIHSYRIPASGWTTMKKKTANKLFKVDKTETTIYQRLIVLEKENDYTSQGIKDNFLSGNLLPYKSDKIMFDKEERTVKTPFFTLTFSKNGTIQSVIDKKTNREYINSKDGEGIHFELYEDRPINWPAWDIQLYHKEMQLDSPIFKGFEFLNDSVKLNFEVERIGNGPAETTTIEQIVTFSEDNPYIDFITVVNWTQHDKLLKVAIPTNIRNRNAKFGIQFGHVQRPTHKNTRRDMAKFEASGRWADYSDESGGISLCSDTKAGFDVHEGILRLSLLKSPMQTDRWADFGIRKFTYRLVFHNTNDISQTIELSDELNVPVIISDFEQPTTPIQEDDNAIPYDASFIELSDTKVILETLKPAYDVDGFIARFYESSGGWRSCNINFPLLDSNEWEVQYVDLLEHPLQNVTHPSKNSGKPTLSFQLDFNSFELVSLIIVRKA